MSLVLGAARFVQLYNPRGFWVLVDRNVGRILGCSTIRYGGIPLAEEAKKCL